MKTTDATRATAEAMPEISRRHSHANATRVAAQSMKLVAEANSAAEDAAAAVKLLAMSLGEWMEKIHGGRAMVGIDHGTEFVVVRIKHGLDRVTAPNLREVV